MAPAVQDKSFQRLMRSIFLAIIITTLVRGLDLPSAPILAVSQFIATLFLNALSMTVLPLILFSVVAGAAKFTQQSTSIRTALSIIAVFAINTLVAASIGALSFNIIEFVTPTAAAYKASAAQVHASYPLTDMLLKIFPPNIFAALAEQNMLGMISFSVLFGGCLGALARSENKQFASLLSGAESLGQVALSVVRCFIDLLPYAVMFFVLNLGLTFNTAHFHRFSSFLLIFFLSVTLYWLAGFIVLSIVARKNPLKVLQSLKVPLITAATTSSSAAALPDLMSVFETNYKMPSSFVRFVTPLGTILNMGASALFICGSVLHLGDLYGYPMTMADQGCLLLLSWITSLGIAGIPSGCLLSLIALLNVLGIPKESLAMILGFDRILDLVRTLTNVFGNSVSVLTLASMMPKEKPTSDDDEE